MADIDLEMEKDSCLEDLKMDAVSKIEEMTGQNLSSDYVAFLQNCNGGNPQKRFFDIDGNSKVVERFLGILEDYKTEPDGWFDVGVVWSQIEDRLNEYLVPFAALFAGDFLCFDYRENSENPKVVLWNHDLSDTKKPHTEFVANNFKDFLKMLYYESNEEIIRTA